MDEDKFETVRIRVTLDGRTVSDEHYTVSPDELTHYVSLSKGSIAAVGAAAAGAVLYGPLAGAIFGPLGSGFDGVLGSVYSFFRTPTVQIFIETKIGGPALGILVKTMIDNLCAEMKRRRADAKAKKVKVVLYGPDGKEITWEDKS